MANVPVLQDVDSVFLACDRDSNTDIILDAIDVGIVDKDTVYRGINLIHKACEEGRSNLLVGLLLRGFPMDQTSANGMMPLHFAALAGKKKIVDQLLHNGADINAVDKNGKTALFYAISSERIGSTESLLIAGAKIVFDNGDLLLIKLAAKSSIYPALVQMGCKRKLYKFISLTMGQFCSLSTSKEKELFTTTVDRQGNSLLMLAIKNALEEEPSSFGLTTWHHFILAILDIEADAKHINKANQTAFTLIEQVPPKHFQLVHALYDTCCQKDGHYDLSKLKISSMSPSLLEYLEEKQPKVLDLRDNFLEFIPPQLAVLPSIEKIKVSGNPLELLTGRELLWPKLQKYLLSIQRRAEHWDERKILLLGAMGSGKSSLAKMITPKRARKPAEESDGNLSLYSFRHETPLTVHIWDFGKDQMASDTHRFFLTSHCTYIVVFDLTEPNYAHIEYWLRCLKGLKSHDRRYKTASVFLVGTRSDADICTEEYLAQKQAFLSQKYRKSIYHHLKGIYLVSTRSGLGMNHFKEALFTDLSVTQKVSVPPSWVLFSDFINEMARESCWVGWGTYKDWARKCNIVSSELLAVTRYLSDFTSSVLFLDRVDTLPKIIILDPRWFSASLPNLISTNDCHSLGVLSLRATHKMLDLSFPSALHPTLIDILKHLEILYLLHPSVPSNNTSFIIPSLLSPDSTPDTLLPHWPALNVKKGNEIGRICTFPFLPVGFFDRFIVIMLHLTNAIMVIHSWRKGVVISLRQEPSCCAKIEFDQSSYKLQSRVRYGKGAALSMPAALLRIIIDTTYTCIDGYNMADNIIWSVVCSHCILLDSVKPFLFPYSDIVQAFQEQETSVFCESICSPSRCVHINVLAPDITLEDFREILPDDVELGAKIGEGGFGTVYVGSLLLKTGERTKVAVKEVNIKEESKEARQQVFLEFQQEVSIMTQMNHPNVVRLFGITKKPLRMVLELVGRGDLLQLLHPHPKEENGLPISRNMFPWRLRLLIALDIALGMNCLQSATPPIIHRDLRSPNIFIHSLSPDPSVVRAKVADFGLSRSSPIGLRGALTTWQWLAPEVLKGNQCYTEKSDNYSYGICCWEIASRQLPFQEYDNDPTYVDPITKNIVPHIIKTAIIEENLRPSMPPKEEEVPKEFLEIIRQCLDTDPTKRPSFTKIISILRKLLCIRSTMRHSLSQKRSALSGTISSIRKRDGAFPVSGDNTQFKKVFQCKEEIHNVEASHNIFCVTSAFQMVCFSFTNGSSCFTYLQGEKEISCFQAADHPVSDSLFIALEGNFWFVDLLGNISIWAPPPQNSTERPEKERDFQVIDQTLGRTYSRIALTPILNQAQHTVWIYTVPNYDYKIQVFSSDGVKQLEIKFDEVIHGLAQYGEMVWISSFHYIYLLDAIFGAFLAKWEAHESHINQLCVVDENIWTADTSGFIQIWNGVGTKINLIGSSNICLGNRIDSMTKVSQYVVTASGSSLVIWDSSTHLPLQECSLDFNPIPRGLCSCSNFLIIAGISRVQVWQECVNPHSQFTFKKAAVHGLRGTNKLSLGMRQKSVGDLGTIFGNARQPNASKDTNFGTVGRKGPRPLPSIPRNTITKPKKPRRIAPACPERKPHTKWQNAPQVPTRNDSRRKTSARVLRQGSTSWRGSSSPKTSPRDSSAIIGLTKDETVK